MADGELLFVRARQVAVYLHRTTHSPRLLFAVKSLTPRSLQSSSSSKKKISNNASKASPVGRQPLAGKADLPSRRSRTDGPDRTGRRKHVGGRANLVTTYASQRQTSPCHRICARNRSLHHHHMTSCISAAPYAGSGERPAVPTTTAEEQIFADNAEPSRARLISLATLKSASEASRHRVKSSRLSRSLAQSLLPATR